MPASRSLFQPRGVAAGVDHDILVFPRCRSGRGEATPQRGRRSPPGSHRHRSASRRCPARRRQARPPGSRLFPAPMTEIRSPIRGRSVPEGIDRRLHVPSASTARAAGARRLAGGRLPPPGHEGCSLVRVQGEHEASEQHRLARRHLADRGIAVFDRKRGTPPTGTVPASRHIGFPARDRARPGASVPREMPEKWVSYEHLTRPGHGQRRVPPERRVRGGFDPEGAGGHGRRRSCIGHAGES